MSDEDPNKWIAKELVTLTVLFLLFLLFFKVGLPLLTGVESPFTVVTSGSMRPTLEIGDLLIVVKADPYQLRVGDIIVFRVPWSKSLIVHRIVRIETDPTGLIFYTKGDNNVVMDPGYRTLNDIYGKVVLRIPYIGGILEILQTLPAKLAIVGIIAGFLLYEYSKRLGAKERDWSEEEGAKGEDEYIWPRGGISDLELGGNRALNGFIP